MDPHKAYKYSPISGKRLKVISQNHLMDESADFHLFISPQPTAVAIIIDEYENIYLSQRARDPHKGSLDLPGGFVEIDETLEDALEREIKEELGFEILNYKYFHSYPNRYLYQGVNNYVLDNVFIVQISNNQEISIGDDVSKLYQFKLNEIPYEKIMMESNKKALRDFLRSINQ